MLMTGVSSGAQQSQGRPAHLQRSPTQAQEQGQGQPQLWLLFFRSLPSGFCSYLISKTWGIWSSSVPRRMERKSLACNWHTADPSQPKQHCQGGRIRGHWQAASTPLRHSCCTPSIPPTSLAPLQLPHPMWISKFLVNCMGLFMWTSQPNHYA